MPKLNTARLITRAPEMPSANSNPALDPFPIATSMTPRSARRQYAAIVLGSRCPAAQIAASRTVIPPAHAIPENNAALSLSQGYVSRNRKRKNKPAP